MKLRAAAALALGLLTASVACQNPAKRKVGFDHPDTYAPLDPAAKAQIDALQAAADAAPQDYEAQKEAGLQMMDYALSGVLPLQPQAERYLERAFALRQDDEELLRTLGRFYNMRAVEHDFSKADMQVEVYGALLGEQEPQAMSVSRFVAYSFFMLAQIIQAADEGQMLRAFSRLRRLEKDLAARTEAQPDDVELHALAGNFALFFAGYVPTGQKKRLRTGIEHFEYVKAHWADMRPGARDEVRCPNTYENFVFELAEAQLAMGEAERARGIYQELSSVRGAVTRGKELIAAASQHRLDNLAAYEGRKELMPPWPSDVGNCIVCHAYTGQLPDNTLYVAPGLSFDLAATPTTAKPRPVLDTEPAAGADDPLGQACGSCHAPSGRAGHILDISDPATVNARREAMVEAIESGWMPPDRTLPPPEREVLVEYVRGLADEPAP